MTTRRICEYSNWRSMVDFVCDTHDGSDFEPLLIEYLKERWHNQWGEIWVDVTLLDAVPSCVYVEVPHLLVWARLPLGYTETVVESIQGCRIARYLLTVESAWKPKSCTEVVPN